MGIDLTPGEKIIYEGHPSWRSILDFYATGAIVTIVLIAALYFGGEIFDDDPPWGLITIIAIAGGGLTALVGFVKRWATRYAITTKRLSIRRGIISRDVQETRLERVQDVGYSQSVIQRILRIGDVDFDTASTDETDKFVFTGVADPDDLLEQVRDLPATGEGLGSAGN